MTTDAIRTALLARLPSLSRLEVHDSLESTNTYARTLAEAGCLDGTVVLARTQTAGRGRFDRRFHSPLDCGMYLSLVVRPACDAEQSPYLTTAAAVAVAEAVEHITGCEVGIKWVNDLWMSGKKVCGILTEGAVDEHGRLRYAVIGIGLNIRATSFPEELADLVTSLEGETGEIYDIAEVTSEVLACLFKQFAHFTDHTHLAAYRVRSVLNGKRVAVTRGNETFEGVVSGIDDNGALLLARNDGTQIAVSSGEVVRVHYNI